MSGLYPDLVDCVQNKAVKAAAWKRYHGIESTTNPPDQLQSGIRVLQKVSLIFDLQLMDLSKPFLPDL